MPKAAKKVQTSPQPKATVGDVVFYKLTDNDARKINANRGSAGRAERQLGCQVHNGNTTQEGQIVALVITSSFIIETEDGSVTICNGQALLDGNDSLWILSAKQGENPGQWQFKPV